MFASAVKTSSSGLNKFLPSAFYTFLYTHTIPPGQHFGDPELLATAILAGAAAAVLREYHTVFPDKAFTDVIDLHGNRYLSVHTIPAKLAALTWSTTTLATIYYTHHYRMQVPEAPLLLLLVVLFHLLSSASNRIAEAAKTYHDPDT